MPSKATPAKPRKRRRWRWVLGIFGVLVLLILLLIALAPTLAGMGWARAIVVAQVNKNLNGHVEIADYSVSWTGGVKASGIRLYDADNSLVAEIASFSTQLSLVDAVRSRYNFGETRVSGVGFTIKQYADGTTNLDRLLKKPAPGPAGPAPAAPAAPSEAAGPGQPSKPVKLPPLRIHFQLADCHGVIERQGTTGTQVVNLDDVGADLNITDINAPIDHSVKIVARIANGRSSGTLTEKGTLAAIQNNQLEPKAATVKETIDLSNFELTGISPFLPASVRQLAGVASGNIDIDVASGRSGTIGVALNVARPTVALASFKPGESLPLDQLSVIFPRGTTIDMSAGPDHWGDWLLKVGDGRTEHIAVLAQKDAVKVLDLTVAADVTAGQLMALAANEKPAGPAPAGRVEVIASANLGKIFQALPKTTGLKDGVLLQSGDLRYDLLVELSSTSAALNQTFDSSIIAGRDTVANRDISIQPLHLTFKGTSFGGGWKVPDLRDLELALHHGDGVNADFQGKTLATVNGTLHLKPRDIMAEVGEFIDLTGKNADGDVTVTAKAEGDLLGGLAGTTQPATNTLRVQAIARDLRLAGFTGGPDSVFAQKFIGITVNTVVDRDPASGQVAAAKDLSLVADIGEESQPNIHADVKAPLVDFKGPVMVRDLTSTVEVADLGKMQTLLDGLKPQTQPAARVPVASGGHSWLDLSVAGEGVPVTIRSGARSRRTISARVFGVRDALDTVLIADGASLPPTSQAAAVPAAPPTRLTGGSLSLKLDLTDTGNQITLVPDLHGKAITFAKGPANGNLGDVILKAKTIIVTDSAASSGPDGQSRPMLERVRQLLIPELLVSGAGATVALAGQPIVINEPASVEASIMPTTAPGTTRPAAPPAGRSPSVTAAISIAGDVESLSNFMDALQGEPASPSYRGSYKFQQNLGTRNGIINVDGTGSIQNFTVLGPDHRSPTFVENNLVIENSVGLDANSAQSTLSINKIRLAMESSKALDVNISGAVRDLTGQRVMDHVFADVAWNGEQLTPIVRSLLAPTPTPGEPHPVDRFKDLSLAGNSKQRFAIWGNYPANQPFDQAITSLSASGALDVPFLDMSGLNIQKLLAPIWMDHGVIKAAYAGAAAPQWATAPSTAPSTAPTTGPAAALATTALCNGGSINLSGISLDLTGATPLLTMPPESRLLENIATNKVLAKYANTYLPVFEESDTSSGRIGFTVHRCDRVPVEQLTKESAGQHAGMDFSISFVQVQLGGQIIDSIEAAAKAFGAKDVRENLRGDIPDAHFQLGGGRLTVQKFDLLTGKNQLPTFKLAGTVGLSAEGQLNLTASLPPQLLKSIDKNIARYLPNQIDFPITGTKTKPRPAFDKAFQKMLTEAGQKALLGNFGGKFLPPVRGPQTPGD